LVEAVFEHELVGQQTFTVANASGQGSNVSQVEVCTCLDGPAEFVVWGTVCTVSRGV
jgi:hypothetical protein